MVDTLASVRVIWPEKSGGIVTLCAPPGVAAGTLGALRDVLAKRGMTTVADSEPDGTHVLRVGGFKDADADVIMHTLSQQGLHVQILQEKHQAPGRARGIANWFGDHTLKASGFTYLLGDISLFLSGMLSKRYKEAFAAALYASGGGVSAIFGNPPAMRQVRNVSVRLGDFLTMNGAHIPTDSALHGIMEQRLGGLSERIRDFFYRHPSEVHNAIYAYGGLQLAKSGWQKYNEREPDPNLDPKLYPNKRKGWHEDMAAGALVAAGGLVGGFIPEKHGTENTASNGIWHWVKEKPLSVSGFLYTLNNFFLIASAWKERKARVDGYVFKFLTAGFFLVANTLMSFSSRDHNNAAKGNGGKQAMVEGLAAEVIAAQPEAMREGLIQQAAGFISLQPETKQDGTIIAESLARKVEVISVSPWRKQSSAQPAEKEEVPPAQTWQQKMQQPAAALAGAVNL